MNNEGTGARPSPLNAKPVAPPMTARTVMVQGTASSVGKSLIAAALCRAFAREGLRVAPFKAQNMSNNASALPSGGEIGRAQALQALAAGVEPDARMNPVLLKPEGDTRSQVILLGSPYKTLKAEDYRLDRAVLWKAVTESLDSLRSEYDLVVIEGAGSPAEINLKAGEIVNMAVARYASSPVLLVGDIDCGGVFAQFAGTLALLEPAERELVRGLVVNKFRGDPTLLGPGLEMIRDITGVRVLGVVPWLRELGLAEEDGAALDAREPGPKSRASPPATEIDIAVVRLPRIANFDDVDALDLEEGVGTRFVSKASELGSPDAVILPGSKATLSDLAWLKAEGLDDGIRWLSRLGRSVVGICGGYQMLGETISDPEGVEGPPRSELGLGLLPVDTLFAPGKSARARRGRVAPGGGGFLATAGGLEVSGYEIHAGRSEVRGPALLELEASGEEGVSSDGSWARSGRVFGSYLHGLFDLPSFRRAWLASLGREAAGPARALSEARQEALDRLADSVSAALDMGELRRIIGV
ncbi:MAG: cobyric acid synthase [Rectinemataceae bacterium]